ncbi:MAG TPA: sigma-70 family RNA polymerase sigma factor [Vicinamibacterales bacterium]|nr:sigma-70 family RNA polymerase sigma factor [Vicinamibacterales bacterium]
MTDIARFEAFVREFQDMVFGTAVRLLGNPAEAEDVAQTVFLRAFERFGRLDSNPARAGWLKTVTTNLCLTHLTRYRARWQFFSEVDASMPAGTATFESSLAAPPVEPLEDADQARSDSARLEQALHALPDHQRVPLVLFHFENQSYQDIATTLGCSVGKIKTDIHRGRETLKRVLAARVSRKGKPAA